MLQDLLIPIEALIILVDGIKLILKKKQPEKLTKLIEEFQLKFADSNPLVVVEAPLILLRHIYNYLLGPKILSRQSLLRTSITSVIFLIILFLFKVWSLGIHKTMTFSPWEIYDLAIASASPTPQMTQTTPPNIYLFISQGIADFLFNHRSLQLKVAYCITFTTIILLFSCIANIISLALTRRIIKDMLPTGGFSVLIGATLTTLAIAFMLITIPISITLSFMFPTLIPLTFPLIPELFRHYLIAIATLPALFTIAGELLLLYVPWFYTAPH